MYFWLIFIIDIVTKKKLQNASWLIIWEINMQNSENKMFIPQESPHMIGEGFHKNIVEAPKAEKKKIPITYLYRQDTQYIHLTDSPKDKMP